MYKTETPKTLKTLCLVMSLISSIIFMNISAAEKLKMAVTPVPGADLLEFIQPILAKEGIELEIFVFNDYIQPNVQLHEKAVDANLFQHKPYLDDFNASHKMDLVSIGAFYLAPMGVYSSKIKNIKDLKDGATISLPNDLTNEGRALILLAEHGLITLKDPTNILSGINDISSNPKKLKFVELEAAMLPRTIEEFDASVINTNFALDAGFNPIKDSLLIESGNSPYANVLAVRAEDKDLPKFKILLSVLYSDEFKNYVLEKYKGSLIPTF